MRADMIDRIRDRQPWDVVVIGGGATGLGTAVDAAARGYRTLLLEARDFAKGTSSRSTKLIHGGVRYLARGEIGLVREALHERAILRRNAPHLVHERKFLVPSYSRWDGWKYGVGLKLYDWLGGGRGFAASRHLSTSEALTAVETLQPSGLRGATLYSDGQFDDARLAISLMRTLLDLGGTALNDMPITGLEKSGDRIVGVRARDEETGDEHRIVARVAVNATGVFADDVRRLDDGHAKSLIRPSRGIHIVLDRAFLPGDVALMVPRTDDGRVLFAIPWHDRVLVGTTDTAVDATSIEPRASGDEIAFLLRHAARYLTRTPRPEDIRSVFAGLRPLLGRGGPGATSRLSREHAVLVSNSGLVTVTGGKWTTYRRMAADAIDRAAEVADLPRVPCSTEGLRLHGATEAIDRGPLAAYGADADDLERLIRTRPEWSERLHPMLPYRAGEVVWAARHEMARQVEDVLARRLRALFLDARASLEVAPRVADLLASELGRDAAWKADQVERFRAVGEGYLPSESAVPMPTAQYESLDGY